MNAARSRVTSHDRSCLLQHNGTKRCRLLQRGHVAEDGISLSLGITEYVFNRGSTLVSLASRRKDEESGIKIIDFTDFSFYVVLCQPLSFILQHLHTGSTVGCSPPFVPLGRGGTPLHPEERKAFLTRLRRLTSAANHSPVLHFAAALLYR